MSPNYRALINVVPGVSSRPSVEATISAGSIAHIRYPKHVDVSRQGIKRVPKSARKLTNSLSDARLLSPPDRQLR